MMMYVDETEIWKCPKHPSRRHLSGVCSTCLKERLNSLCPDCANLRPCGGSDCAAVPTSSSSSTSSFARFFSGSGNASVRRASNPIEAEPSMRRSRSVAVSSLFRSRSRFVREIVGGERTEKDSSSASPAVKGRKRAAFFGMFRRDKSKRSSEVEVGSGESTSCSEDDGNCKRAAEQKTAADVAVEAERARMMRKSRSVAVMSNIFGGAGDVRSAGRSGRGWHFPSPMKAFKQSKAAAAQEGSPLYRG